MIKIEPPFSLQIVLYANEPMISNLSFKIMTPSLGVPVQARTFHLLFLEVFSQNEMDSFLTRILSPFFSLFFPAEIPDEFHRRMRTELP